MPKKGLLTDIIKQLDKLWSTPCTVDSARRITFGRKEWRHASETAEAPEATVYKPGSVTFYPKGNPHDVHGLGEISVHRTVAFKGFAGQRFQELPDEAAEAQLVRRRGSGLPFSINTDLIDHETPARLAVSHVPHSAEGSDALHVWSGVGRLAVPAKFEDVLHPLAMQPATTPAQASERSGIDVAEMLKFWALGFENGLLHNPAQ